MIALIQIIDVFFKVYLIMLFARILGSWIPELQQSRFMQFVSFYTDPYLNFFRRFIPPLGMLDISPIFAFLALELLNYVIKYLLVTLFIR
ncbi:YggT family protein [Estrella lausannensis]|uniref:Conserved putative membrane protein n=1 Tax=Estrella lausannensis TaxID=483423 RepID=A0A0H5DPU5_9BACT|nr:YggT family protein [Estrella lausannensis]CRX37529.1 Conserved putative membrane protein [Estrella lausannensis]